jgi:hypothetical protein
MRRGEEVVAEVVVVVVVVVEARGVEVEVGRGIEAEAVVVEVEVCVWCVGCSATSATSATSFILPSSPTLALTPAPAALGAAASATIADILRAHRDTTGGLHIRLTLCVLALAISGTRTRVWGRKCW